MRNLTLGGRVRVNVHNPSFNCRIGRIVQITRPFVADDQMKSEALMKMPLYDVELEDGSHRKCRGLDLETLTPAGEA